MKATWISKALVLLPAADSSRHQLLVSDPPPPLWMEQRVHKVSWSTSKVEMKEFQALTCKAMKCKILQTWLKTVIRKRMNDVHRWSLNIKCEWLRCLSSQQQRAPKWAQTISNQTAWWLKLGVINQMPKPRCRQELMPNPWLGLTWQQTLIKS